MPASSGVRLPFLLLQGWQQATRFSQVVSPAASAESHDRASFRRKAACAGSTGRYSGRASGCSCAKGAGLVRDAAVFKQADDGRHVQRLPRGMNLRRRHFFRRSHALQNQHQRPARRADVDRLVARVQNKNRPMKSIRTHHSQRSVAAPQAK